MSNNYLATDGVFNGPDSNSSEASENFSSDAPPRLLLMGLRRSGKSSIQKVVFHKMAPSDTLYLESTNQIVKEGRKFICLFRLCFVLNLTGRVENEKVLRV